MLTDVKGARSPRGGGGIALVAALGIAIVALASAWSPPPAAPLAPPSPAPSDPVTLPPAPSVASTATQPAPSLAIDGRVLVLRDNLPADAVASLGSFTIAGPIGPWPGEWHLLSASGGFVSTGLSGDPAEATVQVQGGTLLGAAERTSGSWRIGTLGQGGVFTAYASSEASNVAPSVDPTGHWLLIASNAETAELELIDLASGKAAAVARPAGIERYGYSEARWSPTGETVAVLDCDQVTCSVVVVDTKGGVATALDQVVALATNDSWVLGHRDTTDFRWLAHHLASGERRLLAEDLITSAWSGYAQPDGTFVISGTRGPIFVVAVVDPATGVARSVYESEESEAWLPYLFPLSSDPGWAVIGRREPYSTVFAGGSGLSLLNLENGELIKDAALVSSSN